MAPLSIMGGAVSNYVATPGLASGVPAAYCQFGAATDGSTQTNYLRNRCRRAVDAYGQITTACSLQPNMLGGVVRGPIPGTTLDWAPQGSHAPHVTNMVNLAEHFKFCYVSTNPTLLYKSPGTTCPGLLGWFYVVYNSCNFATTGTTIAPTGQVPMITPLGNVLSPWMVNTGTGTPYVFNLCGGVATASPAAWFTAGPTFRTNRCRKALDQFGRTAYRCRYSPNVPSKIGPNDALITMYDGVAAATGNAIAGGGQPMALAKLAPICN
jgi:hypothetical protein